VGFWGLSLGAAVGLPLLVTEDRIRAAIPGLVAGDHLAAAARQVRVPVSFLMHWDDELVPRPAALALLTRSAHPSRPFAPIPAVTPRFRAMNTRTPQPSSAVTPRFRAMNTRTPQPSSAATSTSQPRLPAFAPTLGGHGDAATARALPALRDRPGHRRPGIPIRDCQMGRWSGVL